MAAAGFTKEDDCYLGPISASPQRIVDAMVDYAAITEQDHVVDLGCNDGRVLITAARERGATGYGIELDADACAKAVKLAATDNVSDKVQIVCGDALKADLRKATVLFLYLLPKGNKKLSERMKKQLKPGTRIVTYIFRLGEDWAPCLTSCKAVSSSSRMDNSNISKLYLYTVPEKRYWNTQGSGPRWSIIAPMVVGAVACAVKLFTSRGKA
mmetsp:Transcript_1124/g.1313  ORF Transcript_1124/g.1313 Transcript_1124/m.1313 type:complete len:212 (-) Transcript_1124:240-875(-)